MSDENIIIFKSMGGMDYIGQLDKETDTEYHISDMLAVMPQQSQQSGEVFVGLGAPVHPVLGKLNDEKYGRVNVTMMKSTVLFTYEPNEQLLQDYKSAVSGLVITQTMPGRM